MRPLLVVLTAALTACGPPPPEPPHVLWSDDVQSLDNPFPDARFVTDAGVQLRANWYRPFLPRTALTARLRALFDGATAQATELRGFGNFAPVLLRTSEPVDPASLPGHFARLEKREGQWQLVEREVDVKVMSDAFLGAAKTAPDLPHYLFVRPRRALVDEGALVVLRGVKTASGALLGRGAAWDATKPAVKELAAALGVREADVLFVLPLRPVDPRPGYRALAAFAKTTQPPVMIPPRAVTNGAVLGRWDAQDPNQHGQLSPWLDAHFARSSPHVGAVVVGTVGLRDARGENGRFRPNTLTAPQDAPVVPVRFVVTVPTGPKPTGGWRTVIGAHGMNSRNTPEVGNDEAFCVELAELFAAQGFACLGIDAPNHGPRGPFLDFFDPKNLGALRDRFRQMHFDLMQLAHAAPTIDVDGDGQGDLSERLTYFGQSMGGIMGSGAVPFMDRVEAAVLNVPGGGLANILTGKGVVDSVALLVVANTELSYGSVEADAVLPVFRAVAQLFVDEGDGVVLARGAPASQAVLVQEALGDQTVPNDTTEDLAVAFDATPLEQARAGEVALRLLSRIDLARHLSPADAARTDPHDAFWKAEPVRTQTLEFLRSFGRRVDTVP